ncbi:hypothetical protein AB0E62_00405 [Streptomyces sp. NPDC038707]|uniref:hypothetical protein n=1 Tax=Streptomyces sp. NPDC038707 TaxID=3154329 RepID=UPI0033C4420E
MDWWTQIGNYASFFSDTPALAVDMALHGPNPSYVGYDLAYGLQASPTAIDVYPPDDPFAEA